MKGARMKALWAILRGFLTAAAATLLGMLLLAAAVIYLEVYALYWQRGGALFSAGAMLLEMLLGGGFGAAVGAVCANLHPRARRRGKAAKA